MLHRHGIAVDCSAACRESQQQPPRKRMVIVALTAAVSDADVADCVAAGMCGHLCKPLRSDALEQLRRYISVGARRDTPRTGATGEAGA